MSQESKPQDHFPNYDNLPINEQTQLAEVTHIGNILSRPTSQNLQQNVQVPFSHFNFFAPYFLGTKPVGDKFVANHDALRNMWLGCCKSLQHDVDVLNDKTGEVVFVVPAYMDTGFLNVNPASLSGESFDKLRRNMESEKNFPDDAVNKYLHGMNNRVESLVSTGPVEANFKRKVEMWAKIYAFYDIDVKTLPGYQPNNNNVNTGRKLDAGFNAHNPFGSFGDFNGSI